LSGLAEWDDIVLLPARSEVLANFFERSPESLSRRQRAETQHRVVSLLDAPVISLNPTIHERAAAMLHVRTEDFPDRPWIRIMAIRGDLLMAN
jgi:hypothetical protein